jgi:predicted helicase
MNIEHAYFERIGEYKAFPGICLVDTFELAEGEQASLGFMTEENAQRVQREKESPIFVIIGNPPYNAGQVNEDDNNRNREYPVIDRRVSETYAKASAASNKNALSDPYIKAIRWASDRIGDEGIVALVTNSSFVRGISFDGARRHLTADFSKIIHVNLKGDARTSSVRRKREGGNIFEDAIRVGVGISFFVRTPGTPKETEILIYDAPDFFTALQKAAILDSAVLWTGLPLKKAQIDSQHSWLTEEEDSAYSSFLITGSKADKGSDGQETIFRTYGSGVATGRDAWAYNYQRQQLERNMEKTINFYNAQLAQWLATTAGKGSIEKYVSQDGTRISWSEGLKNYFRRGSKAEYDAGKVRTCLYRPFTKQNLYFDAHFDERRYQMPSIFPNVASEIENWAICVNDIAARSPFSTLIVTNVPDLHICSSDRFQCFPFYTYAEDGTNRRENITDWAIEQFRAHYHDPSITKWNIFHYIYAVLHHPEYRERYAANLHRELPRIPFVSCTTDCHPEAAESSVSPGTPNEGPLHLAASTGAAGESIVPSTRKERGPQDDIRVFRAFAKAGQRLAKIHVHYEQQPEYKLSKIEKAGEKLDYRVTKMKLSKDKTTLIYNQFLTLSGIPKETCEYRLGNRSPLEWVIDQYQVSTDKRSGIINDPNRADDPQYIVRLIGQVITISLETVKIVHSLPSLGL